MSLDDSVSILPKTSSATINKLDRSGLKSIGDLLEFFPFRYEENRPVISIRNALGSYGWGEQEVKKITLKGQLRQIRHVITKNGHRLQKGTLADESGQIDIIWFNQSFLVNFFQPGANLQVTGIIKPLGRERSLMVSEYDWIGKPFPEAIHTRPLTPVYHENIGLSGRTIREKIFLTVELYKKSLSETLPSDIVKNHDLIPYHQAVNQIHFPDSNDLLEKAQKRLSFDELFVLQLAAQIAKKKWLQGKTVMTVKTDNNFKNKLSHFMQSFPFTLTQAQQRVVQEILKDMSGNVPMNRLLQGDVGSGKTVVAAIAAYITGLSGFKTLFMAPTEILAEQHYVTLQKLFAELGTDYKDRINLVTGSTKNGTGGDIIIGTHSLIYDSFDSRSIGLVVIDEQHKFGVMQRSTLKKKGKGPHLLTMTATPIPRTVLLTLFGDLSVSIIDEMPKNRQKVKTWLVPNSKREKAYQWIEKEITEKKTQAFIICPLIDEAATETMKNLRNVNREYETLSKTIFPNLKVKLLHGRQKSREKTQILNDFGDGEIDILVATPVVEVGIDFPNATIILIEGADRFGLAQLHQLRGRVGRSDKASYCLLFTDHIGENTIRRLDFFKQESSGFRLAEFDLKNRGGGEVFGLRQHGVANLKLATFDNLNYIREVKRTAAAALSNGINLESYPRLNSKIQSLLEKNISWD